MRSRRLLLKAVSCFAMGMSLCMGLLGGGGVMTARAQENGETGIGEAVACEETVTEEAGVAETGIIVDEAELVDASYQNVSVTYDFTTAYEILDIVNKERAAAGLSALTMDKDLLEAAMFRGAEITGCFDHTRPNGTSCFTISSKSYGENIAYGQRNATAVMTAWMGSEGHRNNILRSGYKSIGIGVVVSGGRMHYVQLFGYSSATAVSSKPSNQTVSVNIPLTSDSATVFPTLSYGSSSDDSNLPDYVDNETVFPNTDVTVSYVTHIQDYGWVGSETDVSQWKNNGDISGSMGESKRLEGIRIKLSGNDNLGIEYRTHIQYIGWEKDWKQDGVMSGTSGKAYRLEAIQIRLTGSDSSKYDVYYRVHAQDYGWLGWAKNGVPAGTAAQSKRLEAIQIIVVPKGTAPSGMLTYSYIELGADADNGQTDGLINYMTHVQDYGDQSYVFDGSISGTFGEAKRLEAIRIKLNNELLGCEGGVRYTTHVQYEGWQEDITDSSKWSADGQLSGTSGKSLRLEAICIDLYGEAAEQYDVYYRVHAQDHGWLGWAKNGAPAGTAGQSRRLEGIQIVLVPEGAGAPDDSTEIAFDQD